jgi:hypothetical protein
MYLLRPLSGPRRPARSAIVTHVDAEALELSSALGARVDVIRALGDPVELERVCSRAYPDGRLEVATDLWQRIRPRG